MANLTGKKFGGRTKGTPNKSTAEFKELLLKHGIDPVKKLGHVFPHLEPEKQADVLLKLMEFLYPKRKAVEFVDDEGESMAPVFVFPSDEERLIAIQRIRKTRGLDK